MRIAIVGSRNYPALDDVRRYVNSLPADTVIVSGGARGVDITAEEAARKRGLATFIYPADWTKYGKQAGFRRNRQIVEDCDQVVAFWDGKSHGTAHSLRLAVAMGKPFVVNPAQ